MRKKIFGGLVALALALAPAAGAMAEPYSPDFGGEQHGSLSAEVGAPGDTITYTAPVNTYGSNEAVTQTVTGPGGQAIPVEPDGIPAAADGSHTFTFTIPADAKDGDHYVVQVLRADGTGWDNFVVTATVKPGGGLDPDEGAGLGGDTGTGGGAGSGSGGGLAMTGSDIAIAGLAAGAVLLFVGGCVLLIVRRRRLRAGATV